MQRIDGELLFVETPYRPNPGAFCKGKPHSSLDANRYMVSQWYNCRDVWHYEMKGVTLFFFSHEVGKFRSVCEFIKKIEDILDIQPRSKLGPTQRKTICWIEPSPWWFKLAMRRSLLTIFFRVSQEYKPTEDNFDKALYSHAYTINTQYAIQRFLSGFTWYTGKRRGWYNQFYLLNPDNESINELLIKKN